jgi:hypothetical protein
VYPAPDEVKPMAKHTLDALKLSDLQERYKEVVGEPTRSPNRKFLIRRIEEELEKLEVEKKSKPSRARFKELSVDELREKYVEVLGRPSGSESRPYLIWKIREAEKGNVPVGPRATRKRESEPGDMRVLPLRLEVSAVDKMDAAWRERRIPNRMEFLRQALAHYLKHLGASAAAQAFVDAE